MATQQTTSSQPIASKLHTVGSLLIIVIFALVGRILVANRSATALEEFGRMRIYLIALANEWFLFAYLLLGLRRRASTIREIIDESSWTVRRWGLYGAIAVGTALVWIGCGYVLGRVLPPEPEQVSNLRSLLPHGVMEKGLWMVLSVSAGFCEEFVYRGYLQQQFRRWTGWLSAGIFLQAIMYGVAHAALPWTVVVTLTCLGLLLGGVAGWWKSLVPGMLLHATFDILAGLLS